MSTDDGSVGLSEGMRMTVPLREAKADEKRRKEKYLQATVSLCRRKRGGHTGKSRI